MKASRLRAFTLVELLVVIAIVGLLAALLMPGLSAAWQMAAMTRCQHNLKTIWQAQRTWQADTKSTLLVSGSDWSVRLAPYLEQVGGVFQCPCAPGRDAAPSTAGTRDVVFDIYDIRGGKNDFLFCVPLNGEWARWENITANTVKIGIEDRGYEGGGDNDYADIVMIATFEAGVPIKMEKLPHAPRSGSHLHYRYELRVDDTVIVKNWHLDVPDYHTVAVDQNRVRFWDYGINLGTYEVAAAEVGQVDPALFFILDYGRPVADYNGDGWDDQWDRYFFEDAEAWEAKYGQPGLAGHESYRSLRHFGRANALFCDGHVESLGREDLHPMNPRWRYGGI